MLLLCRKEQGISTPSGKERLHSCGRSTPLVAPTPWPLHSLPPAQPGSCLTELVPNYTHPQHVQPGQTSQTLHCTAMHFHTIDLERGRAGPLATTLVACSAYY